MSGISRRSLLSGIVVAPVACLVKLPDFHDDCDGDFEPFEIWDSKSGIPYISKIKDDPPEKRNWPGCLRITCSMIHRRGGNCCTLFEHHEWEHLYDDEEMMEYGLKSFLLHKEWFAKKLYDEARKPLQSLQHVPEFSWLNNPVKLKLCSIEYCGIDEESGRLLC